MAWFKVDDTLWSHPKFAALSDAAQALWLRAGSYSAEKLTDGLIDDRIIATLLRGKPKTVQELVDAGLWERTDNGVEFHDWLEYQPSAESVKREREQARERMANVRANKRANVRANTTRSSDSPVPVPDPLTDIPPVDQSSPDPNARAKGLDPLQDLIDEKTEQASHRAMLLGIREPQKAWDRLQTAAGVGITFVTAMDLAAMILRDAPPNRPVEKPDAYIASACMKPHEIQERLAHLDVEVLA